jgi:hypothetical protein
MRQHGIRKPQEIRATMRTSNFFVFFSVARDLELAPLREFTRKRLELGETGLEDIKDYKPEGKGPRFSDFESIYR